MPIESSCSVFDRAGNLDDVVAHYGLYLGIGKTDPAVIAEQIAASYGGTEPFARDYPAEYKTLCRITRNVSSKATMRSVADIESAVPGDLHKIDRNPDWKITGYVGAGVFAETGAL